MDAIGTKAKPENQIETTKGNLSFGYKKREGTVNFGGDYETKITALYAIRSALDEDVDDVLIASNAEDYGAFDDIVVRTRYKTGSETLHAVQLKHKANRKKCADFINKKNGDFSLEKYKNTYVKEIACKLLTQNEDHLSRGFAPGDIVLCLFTNAAMCQNRDNILLDGRTSLTCTATPHYAFADSDFINTSSNEYHTFEIHTEPLEFTQFLRSCVFTSNQKGYEDVIRSIAASVEEDNPSIIKDICNAFKKELKNSKLENFEVVLADAAGVVKKLMGEINPQLLEKALTGISEYFRKELASAVLVYGNLPSKCAEYAQFFQQFRFYSDQLDNTQIVKAITSRIERSFGEVQPDVTKKFIEYIQDYNQSDRLLTKQQIRFKLLELMLPPQEQNLQQKFQVFKNVTDLFNPKQKLEVLAHIQVSIQGRKPVRLVEVIDPSFCTPEFLLRNMGETIQIGRKLDMKCENYIKRKFYKIFLRLEVLENTKNYIFILDSGMDKHQDLLADSWPASFFSRWNKMNQLNIVDLTKGQDLPKEVIEGENYVVLTVEDNIDELAAKLLQIKPDGVHYFKVNESCLEWKKSWGSTKKLNNFVVKTKTVEEDDALKYFERTVNVISSIPGMGKTTVLDMLAQYCSSDRWVLRINLNEYNEDLCDRLEEILDDPLEYFYRKTEGNDGENSFCRWLFDCMRRKNAVTVFIDAFDEISPRYTSGVLKLITKLEQLGIYTWVTTRPNAESYIQEDLHLMSTDMEGFSDDDIKNFLIDDQRSLSDFCKIPLHLNMLTTISQKKEIVWEDHLEETDIYDHFITTKCNIYFEKFGVNLKRNHVQEMVAEVDKLIRAHQILALLLIFGRQFLMKHEIVNPDEIKELVQNILKCKNHVGLISTVIDDVPIFSHKTYAEYLTAKWLASNLNHNAFEHMYCEVLSKRNHQVVRFIFDKLVTRAYPLHAAVVNRNLELVRQICNETDLVICDQLKRTPLHLCVSHINKAPRLTDPSNEVICKIMDEIVRRFANQESVLQQLDILGWNWQRYAMKTRINYRLFYEACKWGCSNIISYFVGKKINLFSSKFNTNPVINSSHAIRFIVDECRVDFLNLLLNHKIYTNFEEIATMALRYQRTHVLRLLISKGFKLESSQSIWLDFLKIAFSHRGAGFVNMLGTNIDVNAKCEDGISALHVAAKEGSVEYLKVLMSRGAYLEATDKWGNKPKNIARNESSAECLEDFKKQMIKAIHKDLNSYEEKLGLESITHKLSDLERKEVVQQMLLSGCTPLCAASFTSHLNAVKEIVETWGGVNAANSQDGSTPLHWAVKGEHLSVVEWLIDAGADVNHADQFGFTPLHVVLASLMRAKTTLRSPPNNLDMLKLLVSKGADVFVNRDDQDTYLNLAIKLGSSEVANFFLDCGANPNAEGNFNGNVPLFLVVLWDCFDVLYESMCADELYQKYFSELYYASFSSDSDSYLHLTGSHSFSGTSSNIKLVRRLIANGANVNVTDKHMNTPLFYAVRTRNFELAKLLVQNKVTVVLKNEFGQSSFGLAVESKNWEAFRLFVENGASVNHRDKPEEYTALHQAVKTKRLDMVKYLLAKRAKVNAKVNEQTPLDLALESITSQDCWEAIKLLVENGADVNRSKNSKGNAPLHCAVEEDRLDMAEYFVEKGADISIRNKADLTPLALSRRLNRASIENFFMQEKKVTCNVIHNFFKKRRDK